MKPHKGFTIIELMATFTLAAVVMGIAALWIHQSFDMARSIQSRSETHQTLLRLTSQLRVAVHQGRSISFPDEQTIRIMDADEQITEFAISDTGIHQRGTQGKSVLHDRFPLPRTLVAHWDQSRYPQWITLVVQHNPPQFMSSETADDQHGFVISDDHTAMPVQLYVTAALGRNQRLGIMADQSK